MMNALCNHDFLPYDGRNITKAMAVNALVKVLNLDGSIASVLASQAVRTNPDATAHHFDLDHLSTHGIIEHDSSLAHNDAAFGDNHSFNPEIWAQVLKMYGDVKETSFETVSRARYARVQTAKKAHEEAGLRLQYGIKELILSYGENGLMLALLGDPHSGKTPIEFIRILIEQERLPYNEGWRKPSRVITQSDMNHILKSLYLANNDKAGEAELVALGTIQAVSDSIESIMPTLCTMM